jgi:hypothetical protein
MKCTYSQATYANWEEQHRKHFWTTADLGLRKNMERLPVEI